MSAYQDLLEEYRQLLRAANDAIREGVENTTLWDSSERGTDQAVVFLEWLPDMIKHQEADKIRGRARSYGSTPAAEILRRTADDLDPFYVAKDLSGVPSWFRKTDARLVPWRVMRAPDPDKQKDHVS